MTVTTWTFAIALGVYAYGEGGATAVGIAALVRLLPAALASPFAGMLGDRHSRRLVLILSAALSGLAIGGAAVAAAADAPPWVVYAFGGLFTIASTPYVPAEGGLLPLVARTPQELSACNVIHNQMDSIGFLFASLATGVLLALASPEAAFATAASCGLLAAALLAVERDERPVYDDEGSARGALHEATVGIRLLVADPKLRLVGIAFTLLVFVEGAADMMIVVVALDLLGIGEGNVGWINAAWGVGALIAGAALAVLLERGNMAAGLSIGCLITAPAWRCQASCRSPLPPMPASW